MFDKHVYSLRYTCTVSVGIREWNRNVWTDSSDSRRNVTSFESIS